MDREIVKHYFAKKSKAANTLAYIAMAIFLVAKLMHSMEFFVVGIPFIIISLILYFRKGVSVTDEEYDELVNDDLKQLSETALKKLGVEKNELIAEEVLITAPRLWDIGGASIYYKKGEDGYLRYSPMSVTYINFAQNQLLVYSCVHDVETGLPLNESTEEYFYKDVVSVSTKTESKTINSNDSNIGKIQLNAAESFTLSTSGGTSISIILSDPELIEKLGGSIEKTRAEKAVQSIRTMLREKKSI